MGYQVLANLLSLKIMENLATDYLYVCVAVIELNHHDVKLKNITRELAHSDDTQSQIIMRDFRTGDR